MKRAAPITRKNSRMPSHGIQAGMAGTTVTDSGVDAVWFPMVATISAVKFWGAAAGVASTMSVALELGVCVTRHCGRKVRMKPELGNPSSPKHASSRGSLELRVTPTLALSPTLITTADGLSDKLS